MKKHFDHTKIPHMHKKINGKEVCINLQTNEDESGKKYTQKEIEDIRNKRSA